jgi:hypothetical protein
MARALGVIAVAAVALVFALAARGRTAAPTYYRDVAPILDQKCTTCHRLGGIAPFSLTTARDARAHAGGIVALTRAGLMPPWPPAADSVALVGRDRRRLTARELQTLAAWAKAGAPAGNPADSRSHPILTTGLSGPGRTITLEPPRPYLPHAPQGGIDDYHCFVLNPHLTHDVFVTGAVIRPQRTGIVHHVILYEAAGSQAAAADQLNAEHGGRGWTCFGGPNLPLDLSGSDALERLGQPEWISAWTPGHTTNALPRGTGILLHRGARIVMQVHYNLIEAASADRSKVQLRLRPTGTHLTPLHTALIAAPVELPCPAGIAGPQCTRTHALHQELLHYGALAAFIPDALLRLCNKTLADFSHPVGSGRAISTSCSRAVPTHETIYGVAGHMHLRGHDVAVDLNPGKPSHRRLLHIPDWDFHWQDVYYLAHPLAAKPGDTIRVSCTFDNSAADQPVIGTTQLRPRYVLWGEGTTDEMCLAVLLVSRP